MKDRAEYQKKYREKHKKKLREYNKLWMRKERAKGRFTGTIKKPINI